MHGGKCPKGKKMYGKAKAMPKKKNGMKKNGAKAAAKKKKKK